MNTKMKVLSLALVGAFGYVGAASAACPAGPDQAHGGAWTAVSAVGGSATVVPGGLDGSECRLDSAITANVGSASGFVRDDSPASETRYRAQFKINADALINQNSAQPVRIFAATTDAPANGVPDVVTLTIFGNAAGTARVLGISAACTTTATFRCSTTATLTPTGVNTIEIDWQKATGLKVWVNNGNEASETTSIASDASAWGGVDSAALGLTAGSTAFRAAQAGKAVGFDKFDSRRTTFIGSP